MRRTSELTADVLRPQQRSQPEADGPGPPAVPDGAAGGPCGRLVGDYPAWEYLPDSPLRERMIEVYREQYGKEPVVETVHAGLECGIAGRKAAGTGLCVLRPGSDGHPHPQRADAHRVRPADVEAAVRGSEAQQVNRKTEATPTDSRGCFLRADVVFYLKMILKL